MTPKDEQGRAVVAEQAAEWFVANDAGPLEERESGALVAWLKTSPVNVEEFLGVTVIARDLREACADPEESLEALLARAQVDEAVQPSRPRIFAIGENRPAVRLGLFAAVALAAFGAGGFWAPS